MILQLPSGLTDFDQKRMFSYEHEGKERWVGVPYSAMLTLLDGSQKNCCQLTDGDKAKGWIEIKGEIFDKVLTCIEP